MTQVTITTLIQRCQDELLGINKMLFLPLGCINGEPLDKLEDALEEIFEAGHAEAVFRGVPEHLFTDQSRGWQEEFVWWLVKNGKAGWLVEFQSPLRDYATKRAGPGGFHHSMHFRRVHWVHALSLEAALEAGLVWCAERARADMAKAGVAP